MSQEYSIYLDTRSLRQVELAVLDTETTGLDPATEHIIDVAVVHVTLTSKGVVNPRIAVSSFVKPPKPIPESSSRVHGITDAMVADAEPWERVWLRVQAACEGRIITAFNAPFDAAMIEHENARIGLEGLPWPWLDLQVIRKATKNRGRPGRLAEIAQEHGITLDAHGAAGDALVTALLASPLLMAAYNAKALARPSGTPTRPYRHRRGYGEDRDDDDEEEDLPQPKTIGALMRWQTAAALHQEKDYGVYCRSQGHFSPPQYPWHEREGRQSELPVWPERSVARPLTCGGCGQIVLTQVNKAGEVVRTDLNGDVHQCGLFR